MAFDCIWEYQKALPPRNNMGEAIFLWKSEPGLDAPDLQTSQAEIPKSSAENIARFGLPESGWTLVSGVARPKSRGHLRLIGPDALDPIEIEANFMSHPDDWKAAIACVELCREIGNSAALRPFTKRQGMKLGQEGVELLECCKDEEEACKRGGQSSSCLYH